MVNQKSKAILSPIKNNNKININKNPLLKNKTFALKDNFAIEDLPTTAGTLLLKNFKITYNSTVFEKLLKEGAKPIAKSNLDELAMGFSGLSSAYGYVLNPFDSNKIVGGSSSGSAYLVAKGELDFAIGSDTGDSVRKPAAYAGIVGFKPTWGLVSRYGLFDFAPSWDTVGWFTKNVKDSALLLDILQGKDLKDPTSLEPKENNFLRDINKIKKNNIKIGIIIPFLNEIQDEDIVNKFNLFIDKLKTNNIEIIEIDLDVNLFKTVLTVYRIISSVNAFSTNSNLTSFLFGNYKFEGSNYKEEITKIRSNFLYEVKKRFLLSSEVFLNRKSLYDKSRRIRHLYVEALNDVFKKVDAIVMPPSSNYAPSLDEVLTSVQYSTLMDEYLGVFNANGSPSITIPIIKDGARTFCVNVASAPFNDKKCLQIANLLENYGS